MKARRQAEILAIIQEHDIETQDQLLENEVELIAGGRARKRRLAEIAEHDIVHEIDAENDHVVEYQNKRERKKAFVKILVL